MVKKTRSNSSLGAPFGIGLIWDANGELKPPLTKDHERLGRKMDRAKKHWLKTQLQSDYDRYAEIESELNTAINQAYKDYES